MKGPTPQTKQLSNFQKRLLTAIIGIPLILFGIFWFDGVVIKYILFLVMLALIFENNSLFIEHRSSILNIAMACTAGFIYFVLSDDAKLLDSNSFIFFGAILVLIALPTILFWAYWFQRDSLSEVEKEVAGLSKSLSISLLVGTTLVIIGTVVSLGLLFDSYGAFTVLAVLLIAWVTDTGAYGTGKMVGKRSMAKTISPNKTMEGLYGGYIAGFVVAILIGLFWFMPKFGWTLFGVVCMSLITPILAIGGDLIESAYKRVLNADDSSSLLPGHGGFLDRLDSTIYVAPSLLAWSTWYAGN